MSELMNAPSGERDFRWRLLTTVSVLALLAAAYGSREPAAADQDADRPTVWIEFGGQLEQMQDGQEPFAPPFVANLPDTFFSPLNVQKPLQYSIGGEGKVLFQPDGSDWIFSASLRFGRSNGIKEQHQQTRNAPIPLNVKFTYSSGRTKYIDRGSYYPNNHLKFADATVKQGETHSVLDFQAGKDVGLGMFGNQGSSVLSAGVRFAQFSSKTNVSLLALPDLHYPTKPITSLAERSAFRYAAIHFHDYTAAAYNERSFHGVGPSLAWSASAPFAGNPERGEITLDWGANAAVLFGRQKARGHHQTTVKAYYYNQWHGKDNGCVPNAPCQKTGHFRNKTSYQTGPAHGGQNADYSHVPTAQHSHAANFNRVRTVTVPNLGAFAGLSYRYADAKISFGYRADFFFGAMDGGIDTPKSEDRGFFGPFANISIGLGG